MSMPGESRENSIHRNHVFVAFLTLFAGLSLIGCQGDDTSSGATSLPEVAVVEVRPVVIETRRNWAGTLQPMQVLAVSASESGEIVELLIDDGEPVERGQPLARIDGPELSARRQVLRQRRDTVAEDLERWKRLAAVDAAGAGEVEAARLRLLEVEETLAELEEREKAAELRAPATGRVVGLDVATGSRVERGDVLMRVESVDSLGVRLVLPAAEAAYLEHSDRLRLEERTGNGELTVARIVTYRADELPRGFVAADLRVEGERVAWPRDVVLRYVDEDEGLVVPWTAVARDDDHHWVARVVGDPAEIERVEVSTGRGRADGIEIVEGLTAGDRILRHEPRAHQAGQRVRVRSTGQD